MQIRSVHPFPARMASELALQSMHSLEPGSVVLDPMMGSGTVLKQALALGHRAMGFDLDPLAVLMTRVWTTPVNDMAIEQEMNSLLEESDRLDLRTERAWWQQDYETEEFVRFWFGQTQRRALTRLAIVLQRRHVSRLGPARRAAVNVLRLALSRIIVTKEQCASLARDTSHSRPHRVTLVSNYDVRAGFIRSAQQLRKRILETPAIGAAEVAFGDARAIALEDATVCSVITSPPYLNAIDYMRGHRMSLVWLGHSLEELRNIRSTSIGAERAVQVNNRPQAIAEVTSAMCDVDRLEKRAGLMVTRYANDLIAMTHQVARVLRPGGTATYVVGNSCLKDVFVRNADGVAHAARLAGMREIEVKERDLPANSRYLPMTAEGSLSKRMRTETILTFQRV